VVVREVVPRGAVLAVVLAHGTPRPLGQVRTPRPPRPLAAVCLGEAAALGRTGGLARCVTPATRPVRRVGPAGIGTPAR
jgi:hypothetical protein